MYYIIVGEEELVLNYLKKVVNVGFLDVGWLKYDSIFEKMRCKFVFKFLF